VRARLYSAHQNKDEHHDQDRSEGAGREIAPAGAMGPGRERSDEQQDENDEEDCSERHEISFLAALRTKIRLRDLRLRIVLGVKVEPSDGGEGAVARMIDRLHADDAGRGFRMMARQMRGQFRLGAVQAGDQDRFRLGGRLGDMLEVIVVQ